MCGIVGYIGKEEAYPILIDGLRRLEYRGYDSVGLAVLAENHLNIQKTVGGIDALVSGQRMHGRMGMGHTRWATHGTPTVDNAHPHQDCSGRIALVHNGIIENYRQLRGQLVARGHRLESETDTELIAHLLEEHLDNGVLEALVETAQCLRGSFALVVMDAQDSRHLYVLKQDSPLIIGRSHQGSFVASDIPALLPYTDQITVLEDGEIGVLTVDSAGFFDLRGREVTKHFRQVEWTVEAAEKGGYPHFMLKEIYEQPAAVRNTLRGRLHVENASVLLPLELAGQEIEQVTIIGMGTARHAGLVGKHLIEYLARIPVTVELASEYRCSAQLHRPKSLTIAISQSGETADTLTALRQAAQLGSVTLAITNVRDSSVARNADWTLYTAAGPEIAVASTKAYSAQLALLALFAIWLAEQKGIKLRPELYRHLQEIPMLQEKVLDDMKGIIPSLANRLKKEGNIFYIGRGIDYAVAEEGALKMKEISYIYAHAYPAAELKHGSLALVTDGLPIIALATAARDREEKVVSSIKEAKARGAWVVAVTDEIGGSVADEADEAIILPSVEPLLMPLLSVLPLQMLAYFTGLERGNNVDKPRNLAKSVTVE